MKQRRHALVCLPADTVNRGLRMNDRGAVDIVRAKDQHRMYCEALEWLGYSLIKMPADERYPDSVFVEDPAIIMEDTLVVTRLALPERRGEEDAMKQKLVPHFQNVFEIEAPGTVEGGDVLVTTDMIFIGLSKRTNAEGAEQLARIALNYCDLPSKVFDIPESYLHLKGEVTFHHGFANFFNSKITASEEIAHHFNGHHYPIIVTPADERFGANCISYGNKILIHAGRAKTHNILEEVGYEVEEIQMSEFEKIDGALTCMSKLF